MDKAHQKQHLVRPLVLVRHLLLLLLLLLFPLQSALVVARFALE
jgi:hypothetical protein